MAHGTVKVPFALNASVVLAGGCLELDADPIAGREVRSPSKADDPTGAILQLDNVPHGGLHGEGTVEGRCVVGRFKDVNA